MAIYTKCLPDFLSAIKLLWAVDRRHPIFDLCLTLHNFSFTLNLSTVAEYLRFTSGRGDDDGLPQLYSI